ncbi:unnamed protein product [Rhodiola kirilowii]
MADHQQPHFVLFPFMAQGHTIPIIDIAKLLACRGVTVTLLLTPINHVRLRSVLARASKQGLNIRIEELTFPAKEAGLPPGCENFDALPSNSLAFNFIFATTLLEPQVKTLLINMCPKPSCLVADMCYTYASDMTNELGIPRILFHGTCSFALLCAHRIFTSKVLENVSDLSESFDVPNMPHNISFTMSQIRATLKQDKSWVDFHQKLLNDEKGSFGVVLNTFEELEPEYVRVYEKEKEKKVWCIGPVSLCNKDQSDKVARGNATSIDEEECLKWLGTWDPSSVIYACLGSLCNLPPAQMLELGLGLEASGRPFIWVVRSRGDSKSNELKEKMEKTGLEERLKNSSKGLVIWGWAPQVLILSHPAVGGFLTHCGWNSSLEGIAAGLPMLTWPLFSEQFYNEKLLVDVLRIGVQIQSHYFFHRVFICL